MTIPEVIKKAKEGGWNPTSTEMERGALLHREFWVALGKSMGWKSTGLFKAKTDSKPAREIFEWEFEWINLIAELCDGGTIDSFFEKLQ
jgi:hypothetical protein